MWGTLWWINKRRDGEGIVKLPEIRGMKERWPRKIKESIGDDRTLSYDPHDQDIHCDGYNQALSQVEGIEIELDKKKIDSTIKTVLAPSCTCNDGSGVVCVGCFYRKNLIKALCSHAKEIIKVKP